MTTLASILLLLTLGAQAPEVAPESSPQPDPAAVSEAAEAPPPPPGPLRGFSFKLAAMDEDERAQLEHYLADLKGKPLTLELLAQADERITQIRRYERSRCRPTYNSRALCDIWRARVLRQVNIVGLPTAILETDLRKRIFLRPGEPIDEESETSTKSRLVRQRNRIEDFLEREGFHGAEVRILVKKVGEKGERDVTVRVRGGSFVRVRRADVAEPSPLSENRLRDAFGAMCLTSEGLLDGVFVGNLTSCFNKRRLQATSDRFVEELRGMGYPEARIRVDTRFVDPHKTNDPDCSLTPLEVQRYEEQGLKAPPGCVDLLVHVEAGTRVTVRFHVQGEERPIADAPDFLGGTVLWLRETFLEPASRLTQVTVGTPPSSAADTELVEPRMRETLTFQEATAVDETEIEVSADNIEEYLASRGRVAPRVTVEDREYPGERIIDYTAEATTIAAIRSVRFLGNKTLTEEEILDDAELAAVPRSFGNSGTVSPAQLADDEVRVRNLYAARGFPEASVQAMAQVDPEGTIDVTFVIEEGEPFVLSGLTLEGGSPELTSDVLGAIQHCVGGVATQEKRPPRIADDCKGAPLRPAELDADAQRVQSVYAGRGFPNVEAAVETSFGPKGPALRITVVPAGASAEERASPRPYNVRQVQLGEVFLEGNQQTQRDVLLREAGLLGKSGEPLDPISLGKGISRIRRSGLYESVDLQYIGLDGNSDRAHVRLSVAERPSFTVDTSLGFSTEQLVSLRNEIRHRNVLGTMLDASWLVDFGLFVGRFSQTRTQVRWPRILGTDISASFVPLAISYLDEPAGVRLAVPATPGGQKATATWESPDLRRRLLSVGGSLGLDWRLRDIHPLVDDKLTLGVAIELRYDWLNTAGEPFNPFSQRAFETVDGLLTVFDNDVTRVATFTPRVAYNDVDNPFDPRNGFSGEVFFRGSTPPFVEQGPFGVLGVTARGYKTFFDRLTVAVGGRARLGFAAASENCEEPGCEWALMQNDLLLLGGERSVRGVGENQIGVLGTSYDQQLNPVLEEGEPLVLLHPGFYGAVANLEVRYTLIRQLFIGELRPAVFFDAGVSTDDFDFSLPRAGEPADQRYATGIGAGLRYVLPVGPLSFDVAWSPTRGTTAAYVLFGYVF